MSELRNIEIQIESDKYYTSGPALILSNFLHYYRIVFYSFFFPFLYLLLLTRCKHTRIRPLLYFIGKGQRLVYSDKRVLDCVWARWVLSNQAYYMLPPSLFIMFQLFDLKKPRFLKFRLINFEIMRWKFNFEIRAIDTTYYFGFFGTTC